MLAPPFIRIGLATPSSGEEKGTKVEKPAGVGPVLSSIDQPISSPASPAMGGSFSA